MESGSDLGYRNRYGSLIPCETELQPLTLNSPCEGYLSRDVLKGLDDGPWKTRISEPRPSKGYSRWHGDDEARAAVYGNRNRLKSGVGKEAMRKRGEIVERSFAKPNDQMAIFSPAC